MPEIEEEKKQERRSAPPGYSLLKWLVALLTVVSMTLVGMLWVVIQGEEARAYDRLSSPTYSSVLKNKIDDELRSKGVVDPKDLQSIKVTLTGIQQQIGDVKSSVSALRVDIQRNGDRIDRYIGGHK